MKKIVLIAVFAFMSVSFTDKNDTIKKVDPEFCWVFANAVEANNCGYVGCNYDVWEYAFGECMGFN
jgi:hypothetical protein